MLRDRREGRRRKTKGSKSSCTDMAYAKGGPVNSKRSENERNVKVRQQAHGQKERHKSVSDGKGVEERASERGNESKTKKKQGNIQ